MPELSEMKLKALPLFEGPEPLPQIYNDANEAGCIHRPNKEGITILKGADGKFKVFCIPCMRGRVPWSKSE